jgi:hypothetical protein
MVDDQAVQMLDVMQRKANELFDELRSQFTRDSSSAERTIPAAAAGDEVASSALPSAPLSGGWKEGERLEDESYRWPDGNVDDYTELVTYEGSGEFDGMHLALGHKDNGEWIGFVLGKGGVASKRGIVYFQLADDFAETNELVSMIKGGGANGRGGFAPTDPPPPAYAGFRIESLKERKAGKWNVQAVVAESGDAESMLKHTAIQASLRGLA